MNSPRKIKLCFLANPISSHTAKWVNHFSSNGYEVHVISFEDPLGITPEVFLHKLKSRWKSNLRYFAVTDQLTRIIQSIQPDLLHAHYASGYGTLGRLAKFRPYVLSVWGGDVFEFPAASPLHRMLLRKNLVWADRVCSTSRFMANHVRRYYADEITVTPFGVDCSHFKPHDSASRPEEFVIGTVKLLDEKYGIDCLIKCFALLKKRYGNSKKLRLVIAGEGPLRQKLQKLAVTCGVSNSTEFLGFVPQSAVPEVLNRFSVFAALSNSDSESFGVAVVEASACALPVVVSDAGGLPEVVQNEVTGFVVPRCNPEAAAVAIARLIDDEPLRRRMGEAGRHFVLANYEWSENASRMERLYESLFSVGRNPALSLNREIPILGGNSAN